MSNGNDNVPNGGRARRRDARDFSDAVARLERAVQELVSAARDETLDKATRFINDTSSRIETELHFRRVADDDAERSLDERRRRRRDRHGRDRGRYAAPRSRSLYRDPTDVKIGGVCSGLAHYLGIEAWVVRLAALTGLVFLPGVVFPAYWIAYFVMGKPPRDNLAPSPRDERRARRSARGAALEPEPEPVAETASPHRSLRNSSADMAQIELRLRRMESFVTSGQYDLQRELHKIEQESTPNAS